MGIIGWIIIGAIAGWLASALVGSPRSGCLWNIVVGILGAFVGGLIFSRLDRKEFYFGFDLKTLAVATLGAIILLLIVNLVTRGGRRGVV